MPWAKLCDHFPQHPKIVAAGGDAAWLYVCGLCYCAGNLTDGKLPAAIISRISDRKSPKKLAKKLVEVGLWEEVEGGYLVHDWLDWNPTAEETRAKRDVISETKRKAGRIGAERRWAKGPGDSKSDGTGHGTGIAACHPAAIGSAIPSANGSAITGRWQNDSPDPDPDPDPDPESEAAAVAAASAAAASAAAQLPSQNQPEAAAAPRLPGLTEIEEAIRRYPLFASVDAHALAEHHAGRLMTSGKRLAWLIQAIDECAGKHVGQPLNASALQARLDGFMRHARAPRVDDEQPVRKVVECPDDEPRPTPEQYAARIKEYEEHAAKSKQRDQSATGELKSAESTHDEGAQ